MRTYLSICSLLLVFPVTLFAQQRPEVGYVFPAAAQPGKTVDVVFGGYDFTPDTQFFVLDERVQLEILGPPSELLFLPPPYWFGPKASNKAFPVPREVPARLTIPKQLPAGVIHWQAANANGATTRGQFVITRGPQTVLEDEYSPETSLPVTILGTLERKEEIDQFRFTPKRDGLVTVCLPADGCGYPLHAILKITDSQGQPITEAADTQGDGLVTTFPVIGNEEYTLRLHDLDFRGDRSMVYRLTIEQGSSIQATIPAAVQRGKTQRVAFVGYGLQSGEPRWECVTREVSVPADSESFEYDLETPLGNSSVELRLSTLPESVEPSLQRQLSEISSPTNLEQLLENDVNEVASLQVPGGISGVLEDPLQGDQYQFHAVQGKWYQVKLEAERIGSPLDVAVLVTDSKGKKVAEADDLDATTDADVSFQAKAGDKYQISVRSVSGSARDWLPVYRLAVTEEAAGFRLIAPERAETIIGAEPVETNKRRRRRGETPGLFPLKVVRRGGFEGPIEVQLLGLPKGIAVETPITIPEKESQIEIPIPCSAEASSWASLVTVQANATVDGKRLQEESLVLVAPVMKPRALVRPYYPDAGRTVHRGATYLAPVVLERLEGYKGEITLQLAAHPDRVRQGISGEDLVVPAEATQIDYPLFIPEWVQTDRTSRIVLNTIVQVTDPAGNRRHLVNRMDRRITMNVEGALLKLSADKTEFPIKAGESIEIPLKILRSAKFSGPVEVSLHSNSTEAFHSESVTVTSQEQTASLRVSPKSNSLSPGEYELSIQAIGKLNGGKARLMSQTSVYLIVN